VPPSPPGSFFLCRLLAPRPSFAFDMTADERAVLQEHAVYWRGMLAEGKDPVILSGRGFSYEVLPMLTAVFRE